ncbi:helix-turn-helix domain-containing protein [Kitasatospora aburaviensis]
MIRFDRARHLLGAPGPVPRLAELAVRCGYFDQAHLAREFRALAGCAPSAWLAAEGGRREVPKRPRRGGRAGARVGAVTAARPHRPGRPEQPRARAPLRRSSPWTPPFPLRTPGLPAPGLAQPACP